MYRVERTDQEVDDVLDKATKQGEAGCTRWPGMSYEQGVEAAIRWLIGHDEDNPLDG